MSVRRSLATLGLLLAALAPLAACRDEVSPWAQERIVRMPLREQVAQMVAPAVYVRPDARTSQDTLIARRLAASAVGGVRLLPGSASVAERRVGLIQRTARRPLLVIADLDRGAGGALAGAAELPPPASLATWDGERIRAAAARAAADARAAGVNFAMLSAPSFPRQTALPAPGGARADSAFAAYAQALAENGLIVGLRALSPGPGQADVEYRVLGWDRAAAEALQLGLLRDLLARGVGAVKPASVAVPSLTRDSVPLPDNPVFVTGILRRDLGFDGLVIEDLSPTAPLVRRFGGGEAAVRAVSAGADLLVGVENEREAIDAIVAAVESGRVRREMIEIAVRRIFDAKERLGLGMTGGDSARAVNSARSADQGKPADRGESKEADLADGSADTLAFAAHESALSILGSAPADVLRGCRRTVLVTRQGIAAKSLADALRRRIPGLRHLQTDRLPRRGSLVPPGIAFDAADAGCVIVGAFREARPAVVDRIVPALAWPDSTARAALPDARLAELRRDTTSRQIVWIDFFPATDVAPPRARSVIVVRGEGDAAQRAAAAAVTGAIRAPRLPPGTVWPPARTLRVVAPDSADMRGDTLDAIDRVIRQAIDDGVFSAAAVAVGRRGAIVKLRGYGRTGGAAVDPRTTLFDIASLSKVVGTVPAAMVMVEDERIGLGAPLRRYIPQFRGDGKADVTIRHLLTHTSGLPAGDWLYPLSSRDAALRRVIRSELVTPPGTRVEYSDFGMILLAEAVARRAEEPMDRLLARRIYGPLGMENTFYVPQMELQPRAVPTAQPGSERPYTVDGVVHDGNAYRLGGVAGHAGLFSTAWDLSIYAQTLLNGGAYGTRRVLGNGTISAWTRRQPNAGTRALGWDTPAPRSAAGSYFSERSYGHLGFTGTAIWIDPQRELFVVLLTNRTYTEGSSGRMLEVRARVGDLAAKAVSDQPVRPRPGSPAAIAEAERAAAAARARARARRRTPPRRRRRAQIELPAPPPTFALAQPADVRRWLSGAPVELPGAPGWTITLG
ncbi:serine hydrolase [Longimicrobium sp.]|uniref:serine hydrolase n=1 Tax=Longimicrobium sp. TaxID=2029185 RepID=UPI002E307BA1|nr:serine hydrolase [Longimicrobium sp.]HEX6042255.1 serine hydrolase [Longimicrobium sp.]